MSWYCQARPFAFPPTISMRKLSQTHINRNPHCQLRRLRSIHLIWHRLQLSVGQRCSVPPRTAQGPGDPAGAKARCYLPFD